MSRIKTILLSVASVLAVVAIITPFLLGIAIKHSIYRIVAFYNAQNDTNVVVKEYKRGWFSSDALLYLTVKRPELHKISVIVSDNGETFPTDLTFTLQEHINHGPLLIHAIPQKLLSWGMADIHHNVHLSSELAKFIHPMNVHQPIIRMKSVVEFHGALKQHLALSPFVVLFPDGESTMQFNGMELDVMVEPLLKDVTGHMVVDKTQLITHGLVIEMPNFIGHYNTHLLTSGFWGGKTEVGVPEISVHDAAGKSIALLDIHFDGFLKEHSGLLSGEKVIDIKKIEINNQEYGPLHLHFSAAGMSAQGVSLFFSEYNQFLQENHVYRGEFKDDFYNAVPKMIYPGSTIKIADFSFNTPEGNLNFSGDVYWPESLRALPQTLSDIMSVTKANSHLSVSIPLAKELSGLIIDFFYVPPVDPNPARQQARQQKDIQEESRRNALTIAVLVQDQQVTKAAGAQLMKLQNTNASLLDYNDTLKRLVKSKAISPNAIKILRKTYRDIVYAGMSPDQRADLLLQELMDKVDNWVNVGYVKNANNVYTADLVYENGVFKSNNHRVLMEE